MSVIQDDPKEQQDCQGMEIALEAAHDEWQRQDEEFRNDTSIHHFSYLGDGVGCKNATPAAVSLFVAVTGAKAGLVDRVGEYDPHGYVVMRNAMKFVDPVIYHGSAENLYLRGESLRKAATGLCEKFYSEHGTWQKDRYDCDEEHPALDKMEVADYPIQSLPVNGWFQNPLILDRWDLHTKCHALQRLHSELRREGRERKDGCKRKESLLRDMMTVEDVDPEPKDIASEKESGSPEETMPSRNDDKAKKFDSGWTVNLEEYFGKCDNWADEVDDGDEDDVEESSAAPPKTTSSAVGAQSSAGDEPGTEHGPMSAPLPDPVVAPLEEPLTESELAGDEMSMEESHECDELPVTPPGLQLGAVQNPDTSCNANYNLSERLPEGLTEEVQAQGWDMDGDEPANPENLSLVLQRLQESALLTGSSGTGSSSRSSETDEQNSSAATSCSEPLSTGGSFSAPTRAGQCAPANDPEIVLTTVRDPASFVMSNSFVLPIRQKRHATVEDDQNVPDTMSNSTSLCASRSFSLPIRELQDVQEINPQTVPATVVESYTGTPQGKISGSDESIVIVLSAPVHKDSCLVTNSGTTTDSSVCPRLSSSSPSTQGKPLTATTITTTAAATPPPSTEPPRSVTDVPSIRSKTLKSIWAKVKKKLSSREPSSTSLPTPTPTQKRLVPKKTGKLAKAVKRFLRERIEDLGMVVQLGF